MIYKAAPKVRKILWKLLKVAWKNNLVAPSWQLVWIRLLQKSDDTSHPPKMRPISILNVEGRIFFTIVNKRLANFLLSNSYIDFLVQNLYPGLCRMYRVWCSYAGVNQVCKRVPSAKMYFMVGFG